ncbi:7-cyano-7-deazaguanine tRNA-ribosyltransferase [Ignicoccus pacificus DSM 13166]|uniref:7-cyano-7-deazaguanine tRNA-ribosyltransferase n=1 Tax=Ignicoccus pacificus DSM 13166 TaxID=940294 RepID=A0A977K9J3_9CREN|nr:7-cyano-7-deazaguanine tRNA-ribosyltransferase [Ignicoccus pacificus DSM 13166]
MIWEPIERDGAARLGLLKIHSFRITTPTLLVVVDPDPRKQIVPISYLKKIGIDIIMTSSFIAKRKVGKKNLKEVLGWEGVLYTDSGTYQAYSRGVKVDPVESITYQDSVGVDIATPVDLFSLPTDSKEEALRKAKISIERWKEARALTNKIVTSPVQGGLYPEIRGYATRVYISEGADLLAVGGIVPLMVSYKFKELVDVIAPVMLSRNAGTPVHAFGAGHPLIFPLLVAMGVDMFDSAMYILAAKDGRYLTPWGTLKVEELVKLRDFPCDCDVCSKYTPRDLTGMSKTELIRFLAMHNLNIAWKMVLEIRERIAYGTFYKWAISFSHVHPRLYEGMYHLHHKWRKLLERGESAFPKSTVPRDCALCDKALHTDFGEVRYIDFYKKSFIYAYGKNPSKIGDALLTPTRAIPCPSTLLKEGLVVTVNDVTSSSFKKGDLLEFPKINFKAGSLFLLHDGSQWALGRSEVSYIELLIAKDEDVVFTRSSAPSRDPSEMPCKPDTILRSPLWPRRIIGLPEPKYE